MEQFDLVVVGAGIVGLSAAYQILNSYPKLKIAILEKENAIAQHQTGHNSGVIHSGIYYKPGSRRAVNCKNGRDLLIKFAEENEIEFEVCGKLIAAYDHNEIPQLYKIYERGLQNKIEGIKLLKESELKEIEPFCGGVEAIHVPTTGIIDFKLVCTALRVKIEGAGGKCFFETEIKAIKRSKGKILVQSDAKEFETKYLVACAGLHSDKICKLSGTKSENNIVGFRGDYYELKQGSKHLLRNLIYPVPNPDFPFLGVHLTRMVDGSIECGPNAVFSFKREGYEKTNFSLKDTVESLSHLGTWKLFLKNWKYGLEEYKRAFSKQKFLKSLQRLIPEIKLEDLVEARSGVRAVALSKSGEVVDDFQFNMSRNMIHVINAPSPAATACLAIGIEIRNKLAEMF